MELKQANSEGVILDYRPTNIHEQSPSWKQKIANCDHSIILILGIYNH
jgi:hypothetical protein